MTPTLSVAAAHEMEMLLLVVLVTARFDGVDGGTVSLGHAAVGAVSVAFPERLPAASVASTASVTLVLHGRPENVAFVDVVVVASVPFLYSP